MKVQPLAGSLAVDVEIHPPDRRRRDIDNVLKALLDALQHGGAYHDDNQIVGLSIHECCPIPGGKAIARIEETDGRLQSQRSSSNKSLQDQRKLHGPCRTMAAMTTWRQASQWKSHSISVRAHAIGSLNDPAFPVCIFASAVKNSDDENAIIAIDKTYDIGKQLHSNLPHIPIGHRYFERVGLNTTKN